MILQQPQNRRGAAGTTLLEILVAMLVIGLVATGIITAFIFSRRMTLRSGTELSGSTLVTEVAESLRGAVSGPTASGLTLAPGIYVDQNMQNPPAAGGFAATPLAVLNLPADFQRFQSSSGTAGSTVASADHGDGRLVVVENLGQDLDGDGQTGLDLNGDGVTDLRRVRIRVKWTSPAS